MVETTIDKQAVLKKQIVNELGLAYSQINNVITLLEDGNTVPFIARYRKEMTNGLDEVQIRAVMDRWQYLQNLEERKEEVIRLIAEQDKLTPELKVKIEKAKKLQTIEDYYRPFKQKRRTKATIAKEKGLEPLAKWMWQLPSEGSVEIEAKTYLTEEVSTTEDAIQGAVEIMAEWFSDDANHREWIRKETFKLGKISSKLKKEENDTDHIYEMYYAYEEPVSKVVPHRVLALNRGEKANVLKVGIEADSDRLTNEACRRVIGQRQSVSKEKVKEAIVDGYKRLIQPSIEREIRNELTEKAENQAIHIFSVNLRNLLLQPPLKGKMVLGLDPAYRTGCKLAVVDETGKVLDISVIYPHPPKAKAEESAKKVKEMIRSYNIEVIAIGNGTASQESEQFIANILKDMSDDISYIIVNEAGASVYSASELAREEFPNLQVEERSAVSIARRLQDPLAELVKIDPKSVGVGQYQHDVSQKTLSESLKFVVETAVNQVGVNVNTASASLLQYVSGLSKAVATNIVKYREENGKIKNRKELKTIPRLGAKTYEQSIGFLRVIDGNEPLDKTSIHPERYADTSKLLEKYGLANSDIGTDLLVEKLANISVADDAKSLDIGELTFTDIINDLKKPGLDLRDELPKPILKKDILKLEELKPGMQLQGTVRNVVDFGAFVDVGVKEDGLVHISKLSNRFVKHPLDVVSLGDIVTVWVEQVDIQKKRLALTMLKS